MNSNRRNNDIIRIPISIIENIVKDNQVDYVTISYGVMGDFNMIHITQVTLVVDSNTVIQNLLGRTMHLRDLHVGMRIDATFSARMTRSDPPQSNAYRITVLEQLEPFSVTQGTVLEVDTRNRFLITGNRRNIYSQMRFVVTDATTILDRRGRKIRLGDIIPGQNVRVEHATFQTASIPPQTTAFLIHLL